MKTKKLSIPKIFGVAIMIIMLIALALGINFLPKLTASANNNNSNIAAIAEEDIHSETLIDTMSDKEPAFTFLVHGQSGNAAHWSQLDDKFVYDGQSMIEQIRTASDGVVYVATMQRIGDCNTKNHTCTESCKKDFTLNKISKGSSIPNTNLFSYIETPSSKLITDLSKHITVVFVSTQGDPTQNITGANRLAHNVIYNELETLIDTLSYNYKTLTGSIPKINLVSHSRGGITSVQYATEHPYNVSSMISLGTPYKGSQIAKSSFLVKKLEFTDSVNCDSGQDILSTQRQNEIKDAWNTMLKETGADINAIAIGSKTKLDFLAGLIEGGYAGDYIKSEFLSDLLGKLIEYAGLAIAKLHEEFPIITSFVFACANIGVDILQLFSSDTAAEEIEAIQQIINNSEIAYGDMVLNDDLFIDYNSQTASGYNGFKSFTRVFDKQSANYTLTSTRMAGIPHNLEARDPIIINYVLGTLTYGEYLQSSYEMDTYNSGITVTLLKDYYSKINFSASFDGKYILNSSTSLKKTVFNETTGEIIISSTDSAITFAGEKTKNHSIFISNSTSQSSVTDTIRFSLEDLSTSNGKSLYANASVSFEKSYSTKALRSIHFNSNLQINVYKNNELISASENGIVDILFEPNQKYYFEIVNSYNSDIVLTVSINNVSGMEENAELSSAFYEYDRYYLFTSGTAQTYTFKFNWTDDNAEPIISFYNQSLGSKGVSMVINYGKTKIYKFSMTANEIIYFGFSTSNAPAAPITANMEVAKYTTDYSWKLNGETLIDSTIEVTRNGIYSGSVAFYYNDFPIQGSLVPILNSNKYLTINNGKVSATSATPLTYNDDSLQFVGLQSIDGSFVFTENLKVKILPGTKPTIDTTSDKYNYMFNLSNIDKQNAAEKVTITVKIENYKNQTYSQNVFLDGTSKSNIALDKLSGAYLADVLRLSVESMKYEYYDVQQGINQQVYYNIESSPELFSTNIIKLNGYFSSGIGYDLEPYIIGSERELNNIRYASYYDSNTHWEIINSYFSLKSNITLTNAWIPIEKKFFGKLNGNSYAINNMKIFANQSGKNYGLFESLYYGIVMNLKFNDVSISGLTNDNSDTINVGAVAGFNYRGYIFNCDINSGTIGLYTNNSRVGGITGFNSFGIVDGSYNRGVTINGYGDIGGIVGVNTGNDSVIKSCWNYSTIYYYYNTNNRSIGGIVGINYNSGTVQNCNNKGLIMYANSSSKDTNIAPNMGQIIGLNENASQISNYCNGTTNYNNLKTSVGGFLGIGAKNQRRNCSNEAVGRNI